MEYTCPYNTDVTYFRERTGPNFFRVYYKQGCCIRYSPKDVGRVYGIAKFVPSINETRDWCYEMIHQYGTDEQKVDADYIKWLAKHPDEQPAEPQENTKTII